MVSKRDLLFQGAIFRFHVKLQGCCHFESPHFQETYVPKKHLTFANAGGVIHHRSPYTSVPLGK